MKINWKVRAKNPQFWINLCVSILTIILAYFGLNWGDITTWKALLKLFVDAIQNPVVVCSVLACIWNAINDPTTAGLSDSENALNYTNPKK